LAVKRFTVVITYDEERASKDAILALLYDLPKEYWGIVGSVEEK
jgi:hypothetical protein